MSLQLIRSTSLLLCVLLCACPDDGGDDDGAPSSTSTGDPTTGGPRDTSTGPGMTGNGVTTDDDTTGTVESSTGDASTGNMASSGDDTTTSAGSSDGDSSTGGTSTGGSDSTGEMVDPYGPCGDCPEGSTEIELPGLEGCFCGPECGPDIDCPDPAEGTATPECALAFEPGEPPAACVLTCDGAGSDDQCPTGATCEFYGNAYVCTHPVE